MRNLEQSQISGIGRQWFAHPRTFGCCCLERPWIEACSVSSLRSRLSFSWPSMMALDCSQLSRSMSASGACAHSFVRKTFRFLEDKGLSGTVWGWVLKTDGLSHFESAMSWQTAWRASIVQHDATSHKLWWGLKESPALNLALAKCFCDSLTGHFPTNSDVVLPAEFVDVCRELTLTAFGMAMGPGYAHWTCTVHYAAAVTCIVSPSAKKYLYII